MIKKKYSDYSVLDCPYAKEMREIISSEEYDKAGVAIAVDLEHMDAHYHNTFDKAYFVLDGSMKFQFYDPNTGKTWTEDLEPNETVIVSKGIHHKILKASEHNRLFVVSIPPYHPDDENPYDKI